MSEYSLFFDGAVKNKIASFGYVLYLDGREIDKGWGIIGHGLTSVEAEYSALSHGLDSFVRKTDKPTPALNIYGDSRIVIENVKTLRKDSQELQILAFKLKQVRRLAQVSISWVARTKNTVANGLAKKLRP